MLALLILNCYIKEIYFFIKTHDNSTCFYILNRKLKSTNMSLLASEKLLTSSVAICQGGHPFVIDGIREVSGFYGSTKENLCSWLLVFIFLVLLKRKQG